MGPDLTNVSVTTWGADHHTGDSCFIQEETRYLGAVVVTDQKEVIWTQALPRGTSAQRAEIITLAQALRQAEGEKVNMYTVNMLLPRLVFVDGYMNTGAYSPQKERLLKINVKL